MTWTSVAPRGTISVKANRPLLAGNTTYIENTMGNQIVGTNTNPQTAQDHFWDVDANLDGRHRMVNMPRFTVGGADADPTRASDCDGVIYLKEASAEIGRIEGFYQNANNTYQFIPSYQSGTHVVTDSFTTIITFPASTVCWGEIFMWRDTFGRNTGQAGFFKCEAGVCEAWSYGLRIQGGSTAAYNLRFGNGTDASNLDLRVITDAASSGNTWKYRITYRAG